MGSNKGHDRSFYHFLQCFLHHQPSPSLDFRLQNFELTLAFEQSLLFACRDSNSRLCHWCSYLAWSQFLKVTTGHLMVIGVIWRKKSLRERRLSSILQWIFSILLKWQFPSRLHLHLTQLCFSFLFWMNPDLHLKLNFDQIQSHFDDALWLAKSAVFLTSTYEPHWTNILPYLTSRLVCCVGIRTTEIINIVIEVWFVTDLIILWSYFFFNVS